nr:hypothetical protein [uncultured Psychroserpens sp.]
MEITEINLGFLWDRYIPVLDATSPYETRWNDEKSKFRKFLREESLDKIVEATIIAFKDNYPRALFLYGALSKGFQSEIIEEDDYSGLDQKDIRRNDVLKYRDKTYIDSEDFEYVVEIILEYVPTPNAMESVENGLQGKIYTKVEQVDKTVFQVQDSPISEIEVSSTKFHLKIDRKKLVYRTI